MGNQEVDKHIQELKEYSKRKRELFFLERREDMSDIVNHPKHYTKGNIECIQAIKESMTPDAFKGYLKGNCIKYIWRYENKNGVEDLEKARVHLNWLIEELKAPQASSEKDTTQLEKIAEQIQKDIVNATTVKVND